MKVGMLLLVAAVLVGCQTATTVSRSSLSSVHLQNVAQRWLGVPYRYGGTGYQGIDCSALAQRILEPFGIRLPRTVSQQLRGGVEVTLEQCQPGDLLFFAFSDKPGHVGVYLGDDQFIHASSSAGVIISSLQHPYYRRHLVAVRRYFPSMVTQRSKN